MDRRTADDVINTMSIRRSAWDSASEMVAPVVSEHGLEAYPVGGNIFAPGSKTTPVDQHVDQVINVANWLLEPLT